MVHKPLECCVNYVLHKLLTTCTLVWVNRHHEIHCSEITRLVGGGRDQLTIEDILSVHKPHCNVASLSLLNIVV